MKRALLATAIAVLVGCGDDDRERSVVFYWTFVRHTLTQGNIAYDATVDRGGGDAACPDSGVEAIVITDEAGRAVDVEIPCIFAGVQGVQFDFVPRGTRTWTFTGFQGNTPTYQGAITFDSRFNGVNDVVLEGIPEALELRPFFANASGNPPIAQTCAEANVQSLAYVLVDGAGTEVAKELNVPCGAAAPVLSFTGIDRDVYTVRVQGFRTSVPDRPVFDTATTALIAGAAPCETNPGIDHFAPQTGAAAVLVRLFDVSGQTALCE